MLAIRPKQQQVFEEVALASFEQEMTAHVRKFAPEHCESLGEEQLRVAVHRSVEQSVGHGLRLRGPIRLFVETAFLFGSAFDTDPQYPWIAEILRADEEEMTRAHRMYNRLLFYHKEVSGPGAVNVLHAARNLSVLARNPPALTAENFTESMQQEMHRIFPQKADHVGAEARRALIGAGGDEGRRYGLPLHGLGLVVMLMFTFGHGCAADPLYPWIGQTLTDKRIVDGFARTERLEKKAVTWLDHVLARWKGEV